MKFMMTRAVVAAAVVIGGVHSADALTYGAFNTAPEFLVTPTKPAPNDNEIVIGTGIANGSFTKTVANGVEIGQRAKLRYDAAGDPQNKTNYDEDKTYFFNQADGNAPAGLSIWNIENSVFLSNLTLNEVWLDYSFSDPLGNSLDIDASYYDLVSGNATFLGLNFSQSSENPGFSGFTGAGIDPFAIGLFSSRLSVHECANGVGEFCEKGDLLATNTIHVNQIPLPAGAPLLAAGFAVWGLVQRRRRTA